MKRVVYIITSSPLIVWTLFGDVDHHDFVSAILMPEPYFLCNKSFHVSKGDFILRGFGCFPLILSLGEASQMKVACSDLTIIPLYTAFLWFTASTRGSQTYLLLALSLL